MQLPLACIRHSSLIASPRARSGLLWSCHPDSLPTLSSGPQPKSYRLVHETPIFAHSGPQMIDIRAEAGEAVIVRAGDVIGVGSRSSAAPIHIAVNQRSADGVEVAGAPSSSSSLLLGAGSDGCSSTTATPEVTAVGDCRRFLPLALTVGSDEALPDAACYGLQFGAVIQHTESPLSLSHLSSSPSSLSLDQRSV